MTFISYAHNQEDIFLYRAFKHLPTGFYIDIGVKNPFKDSVTQAFYERTWQGINIDTTQLHHLRFQQDRKRDINLAFRIDSQVNQSYQIKNLAKAIDDHAPPEIHFLKIDVEGAEAAVIRGADWKRHRPWVVLVESTLPNTNTSVHESWEPVLLGNHYHFVWFDGINRFYVADEHSELDGAFKLPINVLDHAISIDAFNLRTGARELQLQLNELQPLRLKLLERELEIHQLNDGIAAARLACEQALAVANRLPCRLARGFLKVPLVLLRKLKALMRMLLTKVLKSVYVLMQGHPRMLARSIRLVEKTPFLSVRLRSLLGVPEKSLRPTNEISGQCPSLAPDQLKIYQQIIGS